MYFVPMGMLNGAPISVGRYVGQSVLPSFIGNSEYALSRPVLCSFVDSFPVLGGCLLGLPMVFMHHSPELPLFLSRTSSRSSTSTVNEVAPTRITSHVVEVPEIKV